MKTLLLNLLTSCLILTFTSCGPKVISTSKTPDNLRKVALLPTESKTQISRERVNTLENSILRNLTARGYQVLNLKEYCLSNNCDNLQAINKYASPDAMMQLEVSSSNSANILAGHYYSVTGKLSLLSVDKQILLSVEHTESDKGGLLFNSGQLLEGLRSTADSLEDDFFPNLSDKFAKTVISKLPAPKGQIISSEILIEKNKISNIGSGRFSICVDSPQAQTVNSRIGFSDYPLRKVSDHTFCGAYLIDSEASGNSSIQITASNLYGQSKTVTLNNPLLLKCDSNKLVKKQDNYLEITSSPECKDLSFSIYSADMTSGPFITKQRAINSATKVQFGSPGPGIISVIATTDKLAAPKQLLFK